MRVSEALRLATEQLGTSATGSAELKARILLKHVLNAGTAGLIAATDDELTSQKENEFFQLVDRANAESVHRIIGFREFHSLEFDLHPETLEPRDDTEALIEAVLDQLMDKKSESLRFADLGTGTGAIAISLLTEIPASTALITDISQDALTTALHNARKLGVSDRCSGIFGPWTEPLDGKFDFIVSNPPYIPSTVVDKLEPIVRDHDPRTALDGGEDGLNAYRIILRDAAEYLNPDGFLALEIGYDQAASVKKLASENDWTFKSLTKDLGNNDRALIFAL